MDSPADTNNREPSQTEPANQQNGDHWVCSDKQKQLIIKLVDEYRLDKAVIEALAKELFGTPVKALNRLQASGLIEELLERHGKKNGRNGGRREHAR